jgi:hypothetical protein
MMKKISIIFGIFALFLFSKCTMEKQDTKNMSLTIEIDYGSNNQRTISTAWEEGLTALEALQYIAEVKTHPVDKYVFVTEIDSVENILGEEVWYYTINGKSAIKLAINKIVSPGDTMSWIYKTDVCSGKAVRCK